MADGSEAGAGGKQQHDPLAGAFGLVGGASRFVAERAQDVGRFAEGIRENVAPRGNGARDVDIKDANGSYIVPDPAVNRREEGELDVLTERYESLTKPGLIEKAGSTIAGWIPDEIKGMAQDAIEGLTQQELYNQAMKIVEEGFSAVERAAASASISEADVLGAINGAYSGERLSSLGEICLLRSYNVAAVAHKRNYQHTIAALLEGGVTGAVGFSGIPFNLVLSTFLYYRAVQSIALFYGYDTKNDPSELVIAGEVFSASLAPRGADLGANVGMVGKVMMLAEVATVGQVVKKGWQAMAKQGGACLVIAQMRALANTAARKALEKAGQEGLEKSVFRNVLLQIGRSLPQKTVERAVPIVGGAIGALFDAGQMQRTLDFADTFYHKRFIVEKELRIQGLVEGIDLDGCFASDAPDSTASHNDA